MIAAVTEFFIEYIGLLVPLTCLFLNTGYLLTFSLGCFDLLLNYRNNISVHAQIIVQVLGNKVINEAPDSWASINHIGPIATLNRLSIFINCLLLPHIGRTKFSLRLTFKIRLLNLNAYRSDDTLTDILGFIILLIELFESLGNRLTESIEMCTTVPGILAIHERHDILAITVSMSHNNLNIISFQMDERI